MRYYLLDMPKLKRTLDKVFWITWATTFGVLVLEVLTTIFYETPNQLFWAGFFLLGVLGGFTAYKIILQNSIKICELVQEEKPVAQ